MAPCLQPCLHTQPLDERLSAWLPQTYPFLSGGAKRGALPGDPSRALLDGDEAPRARVAGGPSPPRVVIPSAAAVGRGILPPFVLGTGDALCHRCGPEHRLQLRRRAAHRYRPRRFYPAGGEPGRIRPGPRPGVPGRLAPAYDRNLEPPLRHETSRCTRRPATKLPAARRPASSYPSSPLT